MTKPPDLDETGRTINLDHLLNAARGTTPLGVDAEADLQRALDQVLAALDVLHVELSVMSKGERADALAAILADADRIQWLALAWRHRRGAVRSHLLRLKELHREGANELRRAIEDAGQRQQQEQPSDRPRSLDSLLRPLKIRGLVAPPGYVVDQRGVWLRGLEEDKRIATRPIVVTRELTDQDGQVRTGLAWRHGKGWRQTTVGRQTIADTRGLIALAHQGAPVHAENARDLVRFLAEFEAANDDRMEKVKGQNTMGWVSEQAFLLGARCLTTPGAEVAELATDEHMLTRAEGYREGGTFEGWTAVVREHVAHRPKAMLAIYASVAAPLLRILGRPSFYVDWSGESSIGKTTTLRVAASVWGLPSDEDDGIIVKWASSSTVGPTTLAHFAQSIPLFMDDTKQGKDWVVSSMLYDFPGGNERMQGNPGGTLRPQRRWRTVMLSTGEAPITSFGVKAGGALGRGLCVRGAPFGDDPDVGRQEARATTRGLLAHHGHLGARVVQWVLTQTPEQLARVREWVARREAELSDACPSAIVGRVASYIAVLEAARRVAELCGCPSPLRTVADPILGEWERLKDAKAETDPPTTALLAVFAWSASNATRFYGRHDIGRITAEQPHGGFVGIWEYHDKWDEVCVIAEVLVELLKRWNYDAEGIIETWHARGWTVPREDGRPRARRRLGEPLKERITVVAIRRSAFEGAEA